MPVSNKKHAELQEELREAYEMISNLIAERDAQPSSLNVQLQELWKRRPVLDEADEQELEQDAPEIPDFDGTRDVLAALTIRANEG